MSPTRIGASAPAYRGTLASALGSAASGLQAAQTRAAHDASQIASNSPDVGAMVDLDVQKDTYSALAVAIRATDAMTATAIDLLA